MHISLIYSEKFSHKLCPNNNLSCLKKANFTCSQTDLLDPWCFSIPGLTIAETALLRLVCMTWWTLLHVVTVSVATLSRGHGVVLLAEVSAVVGDRCSVMVPRRSVWLMHSWQPVWLHIVSRWIMYHSNILHRELQTVAVLSGEISVWLLT